jgi:hypothetical protein
MYEAVVHVNKMHVAGSDNQEKAQRSEGHDLMNFVLFDPFQVHTPGIPR